MLTRGADAISKTRVQSARISAGVAAPLNSARRSALSVISERVSVLPGSPLGSSTRPTRMRPSVGIAHHLDARAEGDNARIAKMALEFGKARAAEHRDHREHRAHRKLRVVDGSGVRHRP
jgi:hypothetical protein